MRKLAIPRAPLSIIAGSLARALSHMNDSSTVFEAHFIHQRFHQVPVETCFRSGVHLSRLGDHFDCINPRGIKRQVLFNAGNRLIRFFVSPNGIFRF
jgi:hypothetical protein